MSAEAEITLTNALSDAIDARNKLAMAREWEHMKTWRFIHEARRQHWSWHRIGEALKVSDNAVKTYYDRNRRQVTK